MNRKEIGLKRLKKIAQDQSGFKKVAKVVFLSNLHSEPRVETLQIKRIFFSGQNEFSNEELKNMERNTAIAIYFLVDDTL